MRKLLAGVLLSISTAALLGMGGQSIPMSALPTSPGASLYPKTDSIPGLIGHWYLCGDSTTAACSATSSATVHDSSSNATNGTWNGTQSGSNSWYDIGVNDSYVSHFNSSDNYVDYGYVPGLTFDRTNPFSVCAWIKVASDGNLHVIAGNLGGVGPMGWEFEVRPSGTMAFAMLNTYPTNWIEVDGTTTVGTNTWRHICSTYSGSSRASGVTNYVDGAADTASVLSDSLTSSTSSTNSFQIGKRFAGSYFFGGDIADVRVYNRAITSTEIAAIYNERNH